MDPVESSAPNVTQISEFIEAILDVSDYTPAGDMKRKPCKRSDFGVDECLSEEEAMKAMDAKMRMRLFNVSGSESYKDINGSTFNLTNVAYSVELVMQLVIGAYWRQAIRDDKKNFKKWIPWSDIVILTPYRAQISCYQDRIARLGLELDLPLGNLIQIYTVDGFQSQESMIVILDIVKTAEDGDIGHLKDSKRALVAVSRAKECLFVVGDKTIPDNEVYTGVESGPLIVNLIRHLVREGCVTKHFGIPPDVVSGFANDENVKRFAGLSTFKDNEAGQSVFDRRHYHPWTQKKLDRKKEEEEKETAATRNDDTIDNTTDDFVAGLATHAASWLKFFGDD